MPLSLVGLMSRFQPRRPHDRMAAVGCKNSVRPQRPNGDVTASCLDQNLSPWGDYFEVHHPRLGRSPTAIFHPEVVGLVPQGFPMGFFRLVPHDLLAQPLHLRRPWQNHRQLLPHCLRHHLPSARHATSATGTTNRNAAAPHCSVAATTAAACGQGK